jgi:hypothetical protein
MTKLTAGRGTELDGLIRTFVAQGPAYGIVLPTLQAKRMRYGFERVGIDCVIEG